MRLNRIILVESFTANELNRYIGESVQFGSFSGKIKFGSGSLRLSSLEHKGLIVMRDDQRFAFTPTLDIFLDQLEEVRMNVPGFAECETDWHQAKYTFS